MTTPRQPSGRDPHEGPRVGSILWERLGADVTASHEASDEAEEARAQVKAPPEGPAAGAEAGSAGTRDPDDEDEFLGDVEVIDDGTSSSDTALSAEDRAALSAEDRAVLDAEEAVAADLAKLESERDDYLEQLLRIKADFDNYRKRILRQQTEHLERAAEGLVEKILGVLDAFDAALAHGEGFNQVHGSLMGVLEKEGLERIDPTGEPFDPTVADAVAHEEGDDGPVVANVLRPGYRWKGRVLRPAMVKVRG